MMKWDEKSSIRERLALLAWMSEMSYDPRSDTWAHPSGVAIEVRSEGTASLKRLAEAGVPMHEAMNAVGHPERRAAIVIECIGPKSYKAMLNVGVQGFTLANVQDDDEAKHYCEFIAKQFKVAMESLGVPVSILSTENL